MVEILESLQYFSVMTVKEPKISNAHSSIILSDLSRRVLEVRTKTCFEKKNPSVIRIINYTLRKPQPSY